ncbi:hypothetical protein AOC36_08285 [Erysipelothrix larvae]|uniref:Uncharacterized protein n=1 Tax=Erysipelothrix larvae TaxID=1514105 RepID=A0A0X8H0U5_9FIRM|nr:hypothetical protein [Erysipelothrix larvae]AMC93983.1 hypothetical protein AOC36_08285 [Erysipelothrix larvae]
MDGLLLGFIVITFTYFLVDLVYQYKIYRISVLRVIFNGYLEYYFSIRKNKIESTRHLNNQLGKHFLVFGKSSQREIGNYILLIHKNGIGFIIVNGKKISKIKQMNNELVRACRNQFLKLVGKIDVEYSFNVFVINSLVSEPYHQGQIAIISENDLVDELELMSSEKQLSPNEMKYLYSLIMNEENLNYGKI